jgi:hypothetical protein
VQRLHVNGGLLRLGFALGTKNPGRPFKQLIAPLFDLIGMDIKLLSQF